MRALNRTRANLSTALSVALLLSLSPSAIAKNKHGKAELSPDADIQAAVMAARLQDQIAGNVETTAPCATAMGAEEKPKREPHQENDEIAPQSKIPLFQSREIAEMEIDADFRKIMKAQKKSDPTPGTIHYRLKNGKQVSLPVQINIRGNSKQTICKTFKPLMLHFKKEDTNGTVFEHIGDHVKLATHCSGMGSHDVNDPNNQLVIRESATYQILEDNGLVGFKTRLAKMTYKDPTGKTVADGMSFFLEPEGKMAERWGYKKVKTPKDFLSVPSQGHQDFLLGKQLVGGNDHYEKMAGHNVIALSKFEKPSKLAFYDLDMSLMANPNYGWMRMMDPISPRTDIEAMKKFINNNPEGPEVGKAVLERALSRKDHTMAIIDQLPIQYKQTMKDRLEMWYGAIEHVTHGGRVPAALMINENVPIGNYGDW
jgi:hypothetical protein